MTAKEATHKVVKDLVMNRSLFSICSDIVSSCPSFSLEELLSFSTSCFLSTANVDVLFRWKREISILTAEPCLEVKISFKISRLFFLGCVDIFNFASIDYFVFNSLNF